MLNILQVIFNILLSTRDKQDLVLFLRNFKDGENSDFLGQMMSNLPTTYVIYTSRAEFHMH